MYLLKTSPRKQRQVTSIILFCLFYLWLSLECAFIAAAVVVWILGLRKASQPSSYLHPNRLTVSVSQTYSESESLFMFCLDQQGAHHPVILESEESLLNHILTTKPRHRLQLNCWVI